MRLVRGFVVVAVVAWAAVTAAAAGVILQPYEAPEWTVSEWINGDPGPLKNLRGRVVIIEFFQLWCPGCNEFSNPLMKAWNEKWADRDDIQVVSIHTVFEGHDVQTPERLREFVRERLIRHPVGIDKYSPTDRETPITMNRFNTGGTPHVAIVDMEGDLRFSHFGRFDAYAIEAFVERLSKENESAFRPPRPPARSNKPRGNPNRSAKTSGGKKGAAKSAPPGRPGKAERGGKGGRPGKPHETTATKEDRDEKAADATEDDDKGSDKLSGSYQVQFQQKSKSCGPRTRPQNLEMDVTVDAERIVARFKQRFLGLNQFAADYNPASGDFSSQTMRRVDENGVGITLNIRLTGQVNLTANPATLQFQFELDKEGDEPGWECKVSGNGSATRSARRP